jgi:hypothetical protein
MWDLDAVVLTGAGRDLFGSASSADGLSISRVMIVVVVVVVVEVVVGLKMNELVLNYDGSFWRKRILLMS